MPRARQNIHPTMPPWVPPVPTADGEAYARANEGRAPLSSSLLKRISLHKFSDVLEMVLKQSDTRWTATLIDDVRSHTICLVVRHLDHAGRALHFFPVIRKKLDLQTLVSKPIPADCPFWVQQMPTHQSRMSGIPTGIRVGLIGLNTERHVFVGMPVMKGEPWKDFSPIASPEDMVRHIRAVADEPANWAEAVGEDQGCGLRAHTGSTLTPRDGAILVHKVLTLGNSV